MLIFAPKGKMINIDYQSGNPTRTHQTSIQLPSDPDSGTGNKHYTYIGHAAQRIFT